MTLTPAGAAVAAATAVSTGAAVAAAMAAAATVFTGAAVGAAVPSDVDGFTGLGAADGVAAGAIALAPRMGVDPAGATAAGSLSGATAGTGIIVAGGGPTSSACGA